MQKKLWLILLSLLISTAAQACELSMGYRTNAKPPLIASMPDNSGLYLDIYTEATQRIGCSLKVIRQPKGRIMHLINEGQIDFYPGLSFTQTRAESIHYIENGLKDGNIGLTRANEKEITSLYQVAERNMIMVVSFGGYDHNAQAYGIHVRKPYDHTLSQLLDLVLNHKADFHAYNLLAVQYYLRNNPDKAKKLKVHMDCCEIAHKMYLGFSSRSPNIKLILNPDFDSSQPVSSSNQPFKADPNSVAGRLQQALKSMLNDGSFQQIYQKYFGPDPS